MTGSLRTIFGAGPRFFRGPALFLAFLLLFAAAPSASADDFIVTELQTRLPDCPSALNKMKIVLISDLHLTAENRSRPVFTELTDRLNLLKPDVLLIAGDIFDAKSKRNTEILAEVWDEFMGRFDERPPLGVFAVLGNHDKLRVDGNEIRALLEKSGVRVLADQVVPIRFQDATLYLAGTEKTPKRPLSKSFLSKITTERPLILLAHYPEIFDLVPDDAEILILAGHTHGGVIRIPGLDDGAVVSLFSPKHRTKYVSGSYGSQDGKKLYVTAGIGGEGTSGHRINNPPEIVIIRLEGT